MPASDGDRTQLLVDVVNHGPSSGCLSVHKRDGKENGAEGNAEVVTRAELYDLVWVWRLAAQFGVSDVALAKRCARMNVPSPG